MSDTADEFGFQGRQLLNKSTLNPLRGRMRAFVSGEGDGAEFEELRREASRGNALSEVAIDERDERL
jgi:hypothetical protein